MNEQRALRTFEAPQWTLQYNGARKLTLQGIATLRSGDESKAADAEIVVVLRDLRITSDEVPQPKNWWLRTSVTFSDILRDVVVDFRNESGMHLHGTAYFSYINSSGIEYTGKGNVDGLVEAGLFPPPPLPKTDRQVVSGIRPFCRHAIHPNGIGGLPE
jgi:hypothetical protein